MTAPAILVKRNPIAGDNFENCNLTPGQVGYSSELPTNFPFSRKHGTKILHSQCHEPDETVFSRVSAKTFIGTITLKLDRCFICFKIIFGTVYIRVQSLSI